MGYDEWLENHKDDKPPIDNTDGVDYVRHQFSTEKGSPLADYEPCDGSMRMCMDEIWNQVKDESYKLAEMSVIALYMDTYCHELDHKWFVWGMAEDFVESFNEMDERVMRVTSDWIERGEKTTMIQYDYK